MIKLSPINRAVPNSFWRRTSGKKKKDCDADKEEDNELQHLFKRIMPQYQFGRF